MLLHRSVAFDLFPADKYVGLSIIAQNFNKKDGGKFTFHKTPINSDPLHLLIRKKPEYLKYITAFNKGLKAIKESGEFQKIISQL